MQVFTHVFTKTIPLSQADYFPINGKRFFSRLLAYISYTISVRYVQHNVCTYHTHIVLNNTQWHSQHTLHNNAHICLHAKPYPLASLKVSTSTACHSPPIHPSLSVATLFLTKSHIQYSYDIYCLFAKLHSSIPTKTIPMYTLLCLMYISICTYSNPLPTCM